MELIWEELGPNFKGIIEMGRPGVIASVIAASQRFHTHEQKVCNWTGLLSVTKGFKTQDYYVQLI